MVSRSGGNAHPFLQPVLTIVLLGTNTLSHKAKTSNSCGRIQLFVLTETDLLQSFLLPALCLVLLLGADRFAEAPLLPSTPIA